MKSSSRFLLFGLLAATLFSSCVGKKKFLALMDDQEKTKLTLEETLKQLNECREEEKNLRSTIVLRERDLTSAQADLQSVKGQNQSLQNQISTLSETNKNLLDRMADLSVISKAGAESIQKSLESINQQSEYIRELNQNIQTKDSTNLALVMNLKRSLADINDEDIQIDVRGGVVYVSISDKLLFSSGSSRITSRAKEVLGKVAKVVNDHSGLDVMVEGHTDNVPIRNDCLADNWDLSVKRATAVVRVLQNDHNVSPNRLTAAGRGEYVPKMDNDSAVSRSANRRTEIILTPKLDEFFKLMEAPKPADRR